MARKNKTRASGFDDITPDYSAMIQQIWDRLDRDMNHGIEERRRHRAMAASFAAGAGAGLLLAIFTIGIWIRVAVLVLR